tara:strand:- start:1327 stop:2718 length:1392 start_codon:yes stop_codon:yes gene_type:complete
MATVNPTDFSPNSIRRLAPEKYVSLGDFIDEINAPDNRDTLVKTYGNQGITGFLQLTGAVKSNGTADQVQYWEETRLHPDQQVTPTAANAAVKSITLALVANTEKPLRLNDIILIGGVDRFIVTNITVGGATGQETTYAGTAVVTAQSLLTTGLTAALTTAVVKVPIIGNLFAQGTGQNDGYLESNVSKRTNPYMIIKETYKVTGSQATNVGWINLGGGDYRWYIKSENDTRQRFIDKREMMMLLGEEITNTAVTAYGDGSEGYFSAIEDRGIVTTAASSEQAIHDIADLDSLIVALDKQGAAAEYAVYCDRAQDLKFDDIIATGVGANLTSGVMSHFGAFNNDKDMAVNLGFASFMRGSYGFHKHSWKLLNEPTLLSGSKYQGVMIPLTKVADPKTGTKANALEMNYKSTNGYSREMEHWMTGSILGVSNTNDDSLQFNYRTECNLVTRAANQHVLLKDYTA